MELKAIEITDEVANPECRGVIFKARVSTYNTKRGIGFTIRLDRMNKLSCPGCEQCGWVDETLEDWISYTGEPPLNFLEVENGKLYTIGICNESRDYETGVINDFDLEVVKVET